MALRKDKVESEIPEGMNLNKILEAVCRSSFLPVLCVAVWFMGCSSSEESQMKMPPPAKGVLYYCGIPAPPSSNLGKVGGVVPLADTQNKSEWCRNVNGLDANALCQQACQAKKFGPQVMCSQVKALEGYGAALYSIPISDTTAVNKCQLNGTLWGTYQGQPPDTTTYYGCIYRGSPKACDASKGMNSPALGVASGSFDNYVATMDVDVAATVVSDEDSSKNGVLKATHSDRALSFNLDDPTTMHVTSLSLPFESFSFGDRWFTSGTANLIGAHVVATKVPGSSSDYAISPNQATFSLVGLDANADGYSVTTTNSTPLTISVNGGAVGPHITGTLRGGLGGHPVHADMNAQLIWLNRPPVAIAKVSNVTFNSSNWAGAKDIQAVCMTTSGPKTWVWHGVPGAKVVVTLDASASYDPDAADSLQYSWNSAPFGDDKTGYMYLPTGNYSAVLTVRDQYYVASVASVKFSVQDLADQGPTDCGGGGQYDPLKVFKRMDLVDHPTPFQSVIRSYAVSKGNIAVNAYTRNQVLKIGDSLGRGFGEAVFQRASTVGLGRARMQALGQARASGKRGSKQSRP